MQTENNKGPSKPRILMINSLDERYGSTYRIRAFRDILAAQGWPMMYVETPGSALRKLVQALCAAASKDYDVLFTQKFNPITLLVIAVSKMRGKCVVVDWDDLDVGLQGHFWKKVLSAMCEWMGPRIVHHMTTHNHHILERAAQHKPAHLLPQGFDGEVFVAHAGERSVSRKRWRFLEDDLVIGHLCTFTYGGMLDLGMILDVWARIVHPRVRFFLIGGGPLEKRVRSQLYERDLSDRVTMSHFLPHEEIPKALQALDAAVVFMTDTPSNRSRVSFKAIECLAMNVPLVGQVVGETDRLFGQWIQKATFKDLDRIVLQVVSARQSHNTADLVASYRWDQVASHLGDIVEQAFVERKAVC